MTYWDELLTTALVGSERRSPPFPAAGSPLADTLVGIQSWEPPRRLLAASGAAALYRRAGHVPAKADTVTPPPANAEAGEVCSSAAERSLGLILSGTHGAVLGEWLQAAAERKLRVPPAVLPELLDSGRQNRALRELILEVSGQRGRWLAAQNPDWSYLAIEADEMASWETGSRAARLLLFGKLRASDPLRARDLLEQSWSREAAEERTGFLRALREGLSTADETFLEMALDDRSKAVRAAAADLLARLSNSAFQSRMRERVLHLLSVRSTSGLLGVGQELQVQVTLPLSFDPSMGRDGIDAKLPQTEKSLGEKAWWLRQMLAFVPPGVWCEISAASPAEILAAGAKTEWRELLVEAWSTGAERSGDSEWAEALLMLPGVWSGSRAELLSILPLDRRDSVVLALLDRGSDVLDNQHPAMRALDQCRHAWSIELSEKVLARCKERVARSATQDWKLHEALPRYGLQMNPALAAEAANGWQVPEQLQSFWATPIERFCSVLRFRREMLEEIQQ